MRLFELCSSETAIVPLSQFSTSGRVLRLGSVAYESLPKNTYISYPLEFIRKAYVVCYSTEPRLVIVCKLQLLQTCLNNGNLARDKEGTLYQAHTFNFAISSRLQTKLLY
jgi:hypothetical protein